MMSTAASPIGIGISVNLKSRSRFLEQHMFECALDAQASDSQDGR